MNCRETERLLDTFFDGELDGRLMRDAALHITQCQTCERELQAKERVKTLVVDTVRDQVDQVDPSELKSMWAGIEDGIRAGESRDLPGGSFAEADVEGQPEASRRDYGGREGGRHGGPARRGGARRSFGRLSATGVGAVAVCVAAFLVFNAGPEQEGAELLVAPNDVPDASVKTAAAPAKVRSPGQSEPEAESVIAANTAGNPSRGEAAMLGPVRTFRAQGAPLGSDWSGLGQVQVGPVQYSDHALALWRDAPAR